MDCLLGRQLREFNVVDTAVFIFWTGVRLVHRDLTAFCN